MTILELKEPARVELALEIAAYMTEIICNLQDVEIAAPGHAPSGPKDWFPNSGPIRYSAAAQRVFNSAYSEMRGVLSGVFGPDRRRRAKTSVPVFPKLDGPLRVELAVAIAEKITETVCRIRGIRIERSGGPKDWNPKGPGDIRYTEEAQDIFNRFYDLAHTIIDGFFPPHRRT